MTDPDRGGQALSPGESRIAGASSILKIGETIVVKSKIFGRHRAVKDVLMGVHRSCWNSVAVRGVVLHRVGRGRWMVNWDVCGEKIPVCMNGEVLTNNILPENAISSANVHQNLVAQSNG
eukprot:587515-Hanusia_phi.AAC.1